MKEKTGKRWGWGGGGGGWGVLGLRVGCRGGESSLETNLGGGAKTCAKTKGAVEGSVRDN